MGKCEDHRTFGLSDPRGLLHRTVSSPAEAIKAERSETLASLGGGFLTASCLQRWGWGGGAEKGKILFLSSPTAS